MDFVQRNLINERNNLQVELAKAKLLIAELSEAATLLRGMEAVKRKSEMSGKKLPTEEEASKALKALQRKKEERADAASSGMGTRIKRPNSFKRKFNEEAEYISDLENVIMAIAESMNMSVEDLLNEGEMRNIRLQKALQKAGDNVRIGNTKLAAMDSHVRDVATTQGGSAGQAADNALYRQKGKTKVGVSQAIEKSTKLSAALDTSTNQVRNSRAARVARGYFSDSPNQQRQAARITSIGNERNNPQAERNLTGNTSSDSLAAQGKLPSKKFGSPVNQRMSLSATRSDSKFARSNQAQAQSDAAKARNQANRPV